MVVGLTVIAVWRASVVPTVAVGTGYPASVDMPPV